MRKDDYERLNDLACGFERLTVNIELAEQMAADLVCGTAGDDVEKVKVHTERLWSLLAGLVEISHLREGDMEKLLKSVSADEKPSGQSVKG